MARKIPQNLVCVRCNDGACAFVLFDQVLERPQAVGSTVDNAEHVLRYLVVAGCLSEMTVESESDSRFEGRKWSLIDERQILSEREVGILCCRPARVLFAAELRVQRECEVDLVL